MNPWCFGGIVFIICFAILGFFGWLKLKKNK